MPRWLKIVMVSIQGEESIFAYERKHRRRWGVDFVALGSHCASLVRPRTALGPAPLAGSAPVRSRRREAPVRSCESVPRAGAGTGFRPGREHVT